MAHLDDIVTNELTGETTNYQHSNLENQFKLTYEVETDYEKMENKVTVRLYVRTNPDYPNDNTNYQYTDIYVRVRNDNYYLGNGESQYALIINPTQGAWVNGVKVTSEATTYTKIMEETVVFPCTNTGRLGIVLYTGFAINGNRYLFSSYNYIYLTLPAFSGMQFNINGTWKRVMTWIKVNGEWKRAYAYQNVNGEWKKYNSTWIWNPT